MSASRSTGAGYPLSLSLSDLAWAHAELGQYDGATQKSMKYYDLKKNWRRVRPHLADKKLNNILVRDFNKFTFGRWGQKFTHGRLPHEFEICDWEFDQRKRGRRPAFWNYTSTPHVIGW